MDQLIIYLIVAIVFWIIIRIVNAIRKQMLMAKMPPEEKLQEYIQDVKNIRANNGGYQMQKQLLLQKGIDEKIAEIILQLVEKEKV